MITSPLRYPGGKTKLFPFFAELIRDNTLFNAEYCEPYAGGAGLAIQLLTNGFVDRVAINDIDRAIFAFWTSALCEPDKFCALIERTPVTVREWHVQKAIWRDKRANDKLKLGFATFFLNRTNRSGIIDGAGPIGGYEQTGGWKIDARLAKDKQIENLRALARFARQIEIQNIDAIDFFRQKVSKTASLVYLDPPYFVNGRKLYTNFYEPKDHKKIARELARKRNFNWVVSYDDVPQIREAYSTFPAIRHRLNYSANEKFLGTEVIYLSDALVRPSLRGIRAAA